MGSFLYENHASVGARIRTSDMTNHELREILIGMWLTLSEDDRIDHIRALEHYLLPNSQPSRAAMTIYRAFQLSRAQAQAQGGPAQNER